MDYWFLFKKTVSLYLNPLTITLEMVVLGLVMIGFARRRSKKKRGRRWLRFKRWSGDAGVLTIVLGALFLYLCSIDPIANSLIYSLEKKFPALPEDDKGKVIVDAFEPEYIVVLAGGTRGPGRKPGFSNLSHKTFSRVAGATLLWKQFPETQMIFTGTPAETKNMAKVAVLLGVDKSKTLQERESRDTKDHAVFIKTMVKERPFFLVTSGFHMPRAMRLFRKQGLAPMPAPNDFRVWPDFDEYNPYQPKKLFPKVINLRHTDIALHEYLGMAWADFRNQTKDEESEPEQEPAPAKKQEEKPTVPKEKGEKQKPPPFNPKGTFAILE